MSRPTALTLARTAPSPAEYMFRGKLSKDSFGIKYVRWPYDPAVSGDGSFTSINPSRWQSELDGFIGWIRSFDPNIFGRYIGGSFVQVGMTAEGGTAPYGRIEGGAWHQGMMRNDGTYDFSKLAVLLDSADSKGLKLLMSIGAQGAYWDGTRYVEYPLPTGEFATLNWTAYQERMRDFFAAMFDFAGNRIAAVEIANEPAKLVRLNTVVGPGHTEQLAVLCRLAKQQIMARGLSTLVLSPPMQGGEAGEITAFLKASAAGVVVRGNDGSGTVGRDWIDVVAHHNYGNFADRAAGGSTAAMDSAGINDPAADAAYPVNTLFTDLLSKAWAVRSAAAAGGFNGPCWNTEFHCTGQVSTSAWYPRKMTIAGLARVYMQLFIASFAGGYDKCFVYAADHPTLGNYDDVGTPPVGEPADWYMKAPDNTARGASAMATAINRLIGGELVIGTTSASANPFYSRAAAPLLTSSSGVFV